MHLLLLMQQALVTDIFHSSTQPFCRSYCNTQGAKLLWSDIIKPTNEAPHECGGEGCETSLFA